MKTFSSILLISLMILISGCKKDSVSPEDALPGELIPLKAGNYWVYKIGHKNTGEDQVWYEYDTLKVISKANGGYLLHSAREYLFPNGLYRNQPGGFYSGDSLEFKYPGKPGDYSGQLGLGSLKGYDGKIAKGLLMKTDHRASFTGPDNITHIYNDCYYYYLDRFYLSADTSTGGHTVIKPGIGILTTDWTVINQNNQSFTNVFCILTDYHLN